MRNLILHKTSLIMTLLLLMMRPVMAETFRYQFAQGDSLPFELSLNSQLSFKNLGSLAQLLNMEGLSHNAYLGGEMYITEAEPEVGASIDVEFQNVSIVMIAGDSVYIDNGSSWGAIRPGSRYGFDISELGEITDFYGPDTLIANQGSRIFQRFFPVFPVEDIGIGYQWQDSLQFDLQLRGMEPITIFARIDYTFAGSDSIGYNICQRFDFTISGSSFDKSDLQLSGNGFFYFDRAAGYVRQNNARLEISALVDLAAFGMPAGLGRGAPVEIDSELKLRLGSGQ